MGQKIQFHRRILDSLPLPAAGTRAEYQDVAAPELVLRVTATGHKTFNLRRKLNGRDVRVSLGTYMRPGDVEPQMTVDQARKLATAAKAAVVVDGVNPTDQKRAARMAGLTLREMLAAYVEDKGDKLKASTAAGYMATLEAVVPKWLDKPLRDITSDRVLAAHKRHGSKANANGAMRVLRLLWNHARTYNPKTGPALYGPNPVDVLSERKAWHRVVRRKTIIKAHALPTWWAVVEAMRESTAPAAGDAADIFELLLMTGLRSSEGRELEWLHVDLHGRTLTVPDPKNRNPHTLPVPSQLVPMFERRAVGALSPYVFPAANDLSRPYAKPTLRKYALALAEKSGVQFTPHDLRRGFATTAESLVSMLTVKRLLNHHTAEGDVTVGYVVADTIALAEAMQRIADKIDLARKGETV